MIGRVRHCAHCTALVWAADGPDGRIMFRTRAAARAYARTGATGNRTGAWPERH